MAQLQSFLVLAEELHFGRAAARLGLAQSALSAQLRRLEEALGVELVTRTSRSVSLTAAGIEMREGASQMLQDMDRTAARASAAAAGHIGVVRVSGNRASMLGLVPRVVRRLRSSVPELVVDVRALETRAQLDAVAAGHVDVAFVRPSGSHPELRFESVYSNPGCAVLSASHPLAGADEIELAALADEPFLLWSREAAPAFHDEILTACRAAGFTPRVAREVSGSIERQAFVAAGLGVSIEASSAACARHRDVRFIPLSGTPLVARLDATWKDGSVDPRRDHVLEAARAEARLLDSEL